MEDQAKLIALYETEREGLREMSRALDADIIELAKNYGQKTESGFELSLPLVSLRNNLTEYFVKGTVGADNDSYVFHVIRKEKDEV